MSVLVDTSVWSQAFRRREVDGESAVVLELRELVEDGQALMIGPIRQELLSGIGRRTQFDDLRDRLRAFPDLRLESTDFERAAEHFTTCRRRGLQGSNTDFLICAVAERLGVSIFTTDRDFVGYARHVPIKLHRPRAGEAGEWQ
jgi:predicted nucleic acid-binding protein